MKSRIISVIMAVCMLLAFLPATAFADASWEGGEWNTNAVFAINREDPHANFFPYASEAEAKEYHNYYPEKSPYYETLNGTWKFNHVMAPADRPMANGVDSFETKGFDASVWDDIEVPGNWQVNWNEDGSFKYDHVIYTNTNYPWKGYGNSTSNYANGTAPQVFNPVGTFRRTFTIPAEWKAENRSVFLNLAGVESNCYIWVNGRQVGYAEDSYTAKNFDITPYIDYDGTNVIAIQVFRWSSGSWFEDQDFLRLSGIFRDIYMIAYPKVALYDFEVKTTPVEADTYNGDWNLDIMALLRDLGATEAMKSGARLSATLYDADDKVVGSGVFSDPDYTTRKNFSGADYVGANIALNLKVTTPKVWSAEYPNLYKLVLSLKNGDTLLETTCIRVGFREVKIVNAGSSTDTRWLINGSRILFYGTNTHEVNPDTGKVLDLEFIRRDIEIMKSNNINSIRMSHYPHNTLYYDLADEYGLYVMDEANIECHGYTTLVSNQANVNAWGPSLRDRVNNMMERDKNYTSVISWSMGNENNNAHADFAIWCTNWAKAKDPSRPVHAQFRNNEADVYSAMYTTASSWRTTTNNQTKPTVLCEYVHAMGNSNGNFDAYISAFDDLPKTNGGFIWEWVDHSVWTPYAPKVADDAYEGFAKDTVTGKGARFGYGDYVTNFEGYAGKALDGYAIFDNDPSYALTNDISVDVYIYSTSSLTGSGGNYTIIGKGDNSYMIKEVNNAIQWFVYTGSWQTLSWTKPADYANKWHRLTGTYKDNTLILYVDGVEVARKTDVSGNISVTSHALAVGECTQNAGRVYEGYIAEARVFNRVLTAAEAAQPMSALNNDPALVFDFEAGEKPTELKMVNPYPGLIYLPFGGDWGDSPSDRNFCADGMIMADRTPYPQLTEMKYSYRMLTATLKDNSTYTVNNKFLFTNANQYDMSWELKENGKVIQSGTGVLDVGPAPSGVASTTMTSKDFEVPFTVPETVIPGAEYFFNMTFTERNDTLWAEAGHVISESHMPIDFAQPASVSAPLPGGSLAVEEDEDSVNISGADFSLTVNKADGVISSYIFKDRDLLVSGPAPNFWRAPNDNEYGASSTLSSLNSWKTVGSGRTTASVTIDDAGRYATIAVNGAFPAKNGTYTTTYTVYPNGEVNVDYNYAFPTLSSNQYVHEIGSMMTVKSDFENLTWFGRGPGESYVDRKWSKFVDLWDSTVTDQFFPYSIGQEMGNKVETRWFALTDDDGFGMVVKGDLIEFNALHYSPFEMGEYRYKHFFETEKSDDIFLRVNLTSTGVGGDNSWGANPLSQYRVNASNKTYNYNYTILPVEKLDTDAAMAYAKTEYDATLNLVVSTSTPRLAEGYAANVLVKVTGPDVNETTPVTVTLFGKSLPVVDGQALFTFAKGEVPSAGEYELSAVIGATDIKATSTVSVVKIDNVWTVGITASDAETEFSFNEAIGAGSDGFKVAVNGNDPITPVKKAGADVLVIDYAAKAGDKIVISGVKFPGLFPSYSFTFTLTYSGQ